MNHAAACRRGGEQAVVNWRCACLAACQLHLRPSPKRRTLVVHAVVGLLELHHHPWQRRQRGHGQQNPHLQREAGRCGTGGKGSGGGDLGFCLAFPRRPGSLYDSVHARFEALRGVRAARPRAQAARGSAEASGRAPGASIAHFRHSPLEIRGAEAPRASCQPHAPPSRAIPVRAVLDQSRSRTAVAGPIPALVSHAPAFTARLAFHAPSDLSGAWAQAPQQRDRSPRMGAAKPHRLPPASTWRPLLLGTLLGCAITLYGPRRALDGACGEQQRHRSNEEPRRG